MSGPVLSQQQVEQEREMLDNKSSNQTCKYNTNSQTKNIKPEGKADFVIPLILLDIIVRAASLT